MSSLRRRQLAWLLLAFAAALRPTAAARGGGRGLHWSAASPGVSRAAPVLEARAFPQHDSIGMRGRGQLTPLDEGTGSLPPTTSQVELGAEDGATDNWELETSSFLSTDEGATQKLSSRLQRSSPSAEDASFLPSSHSAACSVITSTGIVDESALALPSPTVVLYTFATLGDRNAALRMAKDTLSKLDFKLKHKMEAFPMFAAILSKDALHWFCATPSLSTLIKKTQLDQGVGLPL